MADETVLTIPERLSLMLRDVDESIVAAYHLTQENLDTVERPCFLITVGEASYPVDQSSEEQVIFDENYTIEYIGQHFTATDQDYLHTYELQARRIAAKTILYLLKRPNLQFSNVLGRAPESLPALHGVLFARPESRSGIGLMTRTGVDENYGFWGFSINLTVKCMMLADESVELVANTDEV